ncbi:hypothetical protein RUM43_000277 [Polyplax serrata]|uniref:Uncharacterized protein n=1 Tax=Polyplax serrata TaxID=468196 RepID=A0AAN8SCL0_POLSC
MKEDEEEAENQSGTNSGTNGRTGGRPFQLVKTRAAQEEEDDDDEEALLVKIQKGKNKVEKAVKLCYRHPKQ